MPLQLHIFEDRYKTMLHRCLEGDRTFGVVLIRRGYEANAPLAEPFAVGTAARIVQVQPLDDGRMNLTAVGQERFRTLSLNHASAPYLVAATQPFPLVMSNQREQETSAARLRPLVERYMQRLVELGEQTVELQPLPGEPFMLAYLGAILLQVPLVEKQELLEKPTAPALIQRLITLYQRELALMPVLSSAGSPAGMGTFSRN